MKNTMIKKKNVILKETNFDVILKVIFEHKRKECGKYSFKDLCIE